MKNNFIIVAYYTRNTGYEKESKNFIASLEKFNLPFDVEVIDSLGSWQKNTHYKAVFIRRMLDKHKEDLVYIDVDAVIQKHPALFETIECDLAVHLKDGREPLSGTLYIANNKIMRDFWDYLINENRKNFNEHDEIIFGRVFNEWKNRLNVFYFPANYTQIFDSMKNAGEPIVEHFQASRKLKGSI